MKIAIEGCCHGELDKIYETLEYLERRENIKVDLLLCCGDFQAVRNRLDLSCMAVPPKYRHMQTFYKYYSGEKKAPVLTIFIGGNHEASNHLWELPYGGWVAPGIYYLGYSGVVNYGGIRIAGLSGIYKGRDYRLGHFEKPPYDDSTVRSAYHIRSFDVFKLKLLSKPVDIFLSHDWPQGVYNHGNLEKLYRFKNFLKSEIESNTLGSPPGGELLAFLQPQYWFAAHLHVKFPALVPHEMQDGPKFTKFLALDKCLPRREFLQVIDVASTQSPLELAFDPEWLAVTKLTDELTNTMPTFTVLPRSEEGIARFKPNQTAVEEVTKMLNDELKIPENFVITTPPYNPSKPKEKRLGPVVPIMNPQTEQFCKVLMISNPCNPQKEVAMLSTNPEEICLSDECGDIAETGANQGNPDVIVLSGDSEGEETNISASDSGEVVIEENNEMSAYEEDDIQLSPKKRSGLNLPKPMNENADPETSVVADISSSGKKTLYCPMIEMNSDSPRGDGPDRKFMKLVRRNQALYSTDDDEDSN